MRRFMVASLAATVFIQLILSAPLSAQHPARFDWRDYGKVTPPKNQYPYGTCWSHAAAGDLESKLLIRENLNYDFSEANLVTCNLNFGGAYQGGIVKFAVNYLSVWGTVLEACDPYPGTIGTTMTCKNDSCDYYYVVTEWRIIDPERDAIKQAILDYGPVQVKASTYTQYQNWDAIWAINGEGACLAEWPQVLPNHNMLITGWDDELCGFTTMSGGWIVKNSAGIDWGDSGYVYMQYDFGLVEENISVITEYKDWDPDETVYYWDEHGWMDETGYGDGVDWALVEISSTGTEYLHAVNLWAVTGPLDYELYIYDDFNGSSPSNQIGETLSGTFMEAGFYTIDLPVLVSLTSGDPVYIAMRLDGYGYSDPVPIDDTGPMETDKCFISNTGVSYQAADAGNLAIGDIGIRGRATTDMDRGDPAFYETSYERTVYAYPGQIITTVLHPANFGGITPTPCDGADSFCVYLASPPPPAGTITGSPVSLGAPFLMSASMYFNFNVEITVPCLAPVGHIETHIFRMTYWEDGEYLDGHYDCVDPNVYNSSDYFSEHIVRVEIIENPDPFVLFGEDEVEIGMDIPQCGVRFDVHNGDPCYSPGSFGYRIVSGGSIGDPIFQEGIIDSVPAGETGLTFAVLDTRGVSAGASDDITMYAWCLYDTTVVDTFTTRVNVVTTTDVEEIPELPAAFSLEQNYPNPFNPFTEIGYALPESRNVLLRIFDVSGRLVTTLVDDFQEAGYRSVSWDGTDSRGMTVSSGVYFYQIIAGDWSEQKKMILLR